MHGFSYNSQFKKNNCQSTHSYSRNIWVAIPSYIIFPCSHVSVYLHLYSATLIFRTPDYLISPILCIISLGPWFFLTRHFQFTSDFSNFGFSNSPFSGASFQFVIFNQNSFVIPPGLLYHLIRRDSGRLANESFTSNLIVSPKQ